MQNRRKLIASGSLLAIGAAVTTLAACGSNTPTPPGTIPTQVIADVNGALQQLQNVLPSLVTAKVLTSAQEQPIMAAITQAMSFMTTIGPNSPAQTATTALARVEGYFNAALAALVAVPIPSPYNEIVIAANVIAPELESYLNSVIPAVAPASTSAKRAMKVSGGMSIDEARTVLHVTK